MSKSFGRWAKRVSDVKRERIIVARIGRRMLNRRVASALDSWYMFAENQKYLRKIMLRALVKMTKTLLQRGFRSWLDYNRLKIHMLLQDENRSRKIKFVVKRILQQTLSKSINAWCDFVNTKRKLRIIGRRMLNRRVAKSMDTWVHYIDKQRASKKVILHVVQRLQRILIVKGMKS